MPTRNLSQLGALLGGTVTVALIFITIIGFVAILFVRKCKLKRRGKFAVDVAMAGGTTQEMGEFDEIAVILMQTNMSTSTLRKCTHRISSQ